MSLPLSGIRVVSMAEQYPGPYATLLMGDLGAEVVLVDRPQGGDPARQFPEFHAALNRNKKAVTIDLKSEQGRMTLERLLADADIFMEGFRPGAMARLGFGPEQLAIRHPRLVYVSISGFGQSGPYRDRPAHDLSYQGIAGLLFTAARTVSPSATSDIAIGDLTAGMFATIGSLAALLERARTGKGGHVDVSMTDCLVSTMTALLGPVMNGQEPADIGAEPAYGTFICGDDKLLTLSIAHEDWFWMPFCQLVGMEDKSALRRGERVRQAEALTSRIAMALRARTRHEWGEIFDAAGIPWGPVNDLNEVISDVHFKERGMFGQLPDANGTLRWHVLQPLLFSGQRPGPVFGVPSLGADNEEVL